MKSTRFFLFAFVLFFSFFTTVAISQTPSVPFGAYVIKNMQPVSTPAAATTGALPAPLQTRLIHDRRLAPAGVATGQTFIVTDPGDAPDSDLNDGICSPATLRAAIQNANLNPDFDVIAFGTSIIGVQPQTPLPDCIHPLLIDGYTSDSTKAVLDGAFATGAAGLVLKGGYSAVSNLEIRYFAKAGVVIQGDDSSGVRGCWIHDNKGAGVQIVSSNANLIGGMNTGYYNFIWSNAGDGVSIDSGSIGNGVVNCIIGSTNGLLPSANYRGVYMESGSNLVYACLVSGNANNGIEIAGLGNNSCNNLIEGNYIGTTTYGTGSLANGANGIAISNSRTDTIRNNLISGNFAGSGIQLGGSGNPAQGTVIYVNYLGLDITGLSSVPNMNGISGKGKDIMALLNTISGNSAKGISGSGSGWDIRRNRIGVDTSGNRALANGDCGIALLASSGGPTIGMSIGGATSSEGNQISGNGSHGISLGAGVDSTIIRSNNIGLKSTLGAALPNAGSGIAISGTKAIITSNIISGNTSNGILIDGAANPAATQATIKSNFIGVDVTAAKAIANGGSGILITNASANIIGGTTVGDGNIISGNRQIGVDISGSAGGGNSIIGNFIGTDATGNSAVGNGGYGIHIQTSKNNIIGGSATQSGNIISGNGFCGIFITADSNAVQGNLIGTDKTGGKSIPNKGHGVHLLKANNNLIGGGSTATANTIAGNAMCGIFGLHSDSNALSGNYIGVSSVGDAGVPNGLHGIELDSSANNIIGGYQLQYGNIIGGNTKDGVFLSASDSNLVAENSIGANAGGVLQLENGGNGITVTSSNANIIGGAACGNLIAFNTGIGVHILSGIKNAIINNSIFTNGGLGIALGVDGVTKNDSLDADTGPNQFQNYPTLLKAYAGNPSTVNGVFSGAPNDSLHLEFFASTEKDPTGYGEGQRFLGSIEIKTGNFGTTPFSGSLASLVNAGEYITATATDYKGNTSEFSQAILAEGALQAADLEISIASNKDTVGIGDTITYTIIANNKGPSSASSVMIIDTIGENVAYVSSSTTKGTLTHSGNIVQVSVPTLAAQESAILTVVVTALQERTTRDSAVVSALEPDMTLSNNSAAKHVIILAYADLSLTLQVNRDTVHVGDTISYTLTVLNNGPQASLNTDIDFHFGDFVSYQGSTITKGMVYPKTNWLQALIGNLMPKESVVLQVFVLAQKAGITSNTASTSTSTNDKTLSNNSSQDSVIILPATAVEADAGAPSDISLLENYPNPFRGTTSIPFSINKNGYIRLVITDILGREAEVLAENYFSPGNYTVNWHAKDQPAGMYFCTLVGGNTRMTKAMFLVK